MQQMSLATNVINNIIFILVKYLCKLHYPQVVRLDHFVSLSSWGWVRTFVYLILLWLGQIICLSYPPLVRFDHLFILSSCGQVRSIIYLMVLWLGQIICLSYPDKIQYQYVCRIIIIFLLTKYGTSMQDNNNIPPDKIRYEYVG